MKEREKRRGGQGRGNTSTNYLKQLGNDLTSEVHITGEQFIWRWLVACECLKEAAHILADLHFRDQLEKRRREERGEK